MKGEVFVWCCQTAPTPSNGMQRQRCIQTALQSFGSKAALLIKSAASFRKRCVGGITTASVCHKCRNSAHMISFHYNHTRFLKLTIQPYMVNAKLHSRSGVLNNNTIRPPFYLCVYYLLLLYIHYMHLTEGLCSGYDEVAQNVMEIKQIKYQWWITSS